MPKSVYTPEEMLESVIKKFDRSKKTSYDYVELFLVFNAAAHGAKHNGIATHDFLEPIIKRVLGEYSDES